MTDERPIERFDITLSSYLDSLMTKHFDVLNFKEEHVDMNKKTLNIINDVDEIMLIAKTIRSKRWINKYRPVRDIPTPKFLKQKPTSLHTSIFSAKYITWAIKFITAKGNKSIFITKNIALEIGSNAPIRISNDDFDILIAPIIEHK